MTIKNKATNYIDDLSSEEDCEHNGICDDISGTPISSFSFTEENTANDDILPDNRKLKTKANEITPPIDGETLDTKRYYKIRKSTARILNEIKAIHPDVNVYMNKIVDAALRHYYDYIFNKDGHRTL